MNSRVEFFNENHEKLVGVYHKNDSDTLLILCHGYKIHKDFPAIKGIAEELSKRGYSVFRFDFSGHGESEGIFEINIPKHVSEIGSAIKHFKQYKHIVLIGGSYAAFLTVIASLKYPVSKLITINGLFDITKIGWRYHLFKLSALFNQKSRAQLEYYAQNYHPGKINIPVLLIHSKTDKTVSIKQSEKFYSQIKGKMETLSETDHQISKQEDRVKIAGMIDSWLS